MIELDKGVRKEIKREGGDEALVMGKSYMSEGNHKWIDCTYVRIMMNIKSIFTYTHEFIHSYLYIYIHIHTYIPHIHKP